MKKLMLVLALTFTTSVMFTSCREESGIEQAADDVGDEIEEVGDDLEDAGN